MRYYLAVDLGRQAKMIQPWKTAVSFLKRSTVSTTIWLKNGRLCWDLETCSIVSCRG